MPPWSLPRGSRGRGGRGFDRLPKRWVVEQTFGCLLRKKFRYKRPHKTAA